LPFESDAAKSTRTFEENKSTPRLSAAQLSSQYIYIGTKGVMGTQTRGGAAHRAQVAFLSNIFGSC